jgi:membrane protein
MKSLKAMFKLLKEAASEWVADKCPRLGAALSYYTIFAIPPLFIIVIFIASLVFDEKEVRNSLFGQVGGLVGEKGAASIQSALTASESHKQGMVASVLAVVTLLLTSTGLFIELQSALNTVWGVESKPGQGVWGFLKNRLLSFAMIVGIGFLLLVSLVVSAALSAVSKYFSALVPGLDVLWTIVNLFVSLGVITVLFAMMFKVLPDVKIAWRDVWVGAFLTAALFTAGKFFLGLYLGHNSAVSAYGAAGSIVLILLWVYYSAQILFFGAEFTQVYAYKYGRQLQPKAHARWAEPAAPAAAKAAKRERGERKPIKSSGRKGVLVSMLQDEVEELRTVVRQTGGVARASGASDK